MDHFCQRGGKPLCVLEICGEFRGDACFFTELQVKKYMLLAGEVEEERSVRDAGGCHDRVHVGACHPRTLELGDRRTEYALPGLSPTHLACRGLDLWRHGLVFVARLLTGVND